MDVEETAISGVLLIKPQVFGDARGYFVETWQSARYAELGIPTTFVQDNISFSPHGVLRGLHWQSPYAQGKLVTVLQGEVFDVAVDLRPDSLTFGKWVGTVLSAENHYQLWVPPGLAHGFCVTSDTALFSYKCTEFYRPEAERCILWNDETLDIEWPLADVTVSSKDQAGMTFVQATGESKVWESGISTRSG